MRGIFPSGIPMPVSEMRMVISESFGAPNHLDPAPGWRILHRIIYKIGEHRGQLCLVSVDGVLCGLTEAFPLQGDIFLSGDASHAGEHGHQDAAHVDEGGVIDGLLAFEARQVEEVRNEVGEAFGLFFELRGEEARLDGILVEGLFEALGQQLQARGRGLELVGDVGDEIAPDLVDPLEFIGANVSGTVLSLQRHLLLPAF